VPRAAAEDRLRRILAVVPWVAAEDGPTVADVCARFGYASEMELQEDLNLLFLCGVPPYTPDALIEVDVADGRVWIRYADWFARPLRLTAAEALSLVAGSTALLGSGAGDVEGPLARGLAKLAAALGVTEEVVDVTFGAAPAEPLEVLRRAAEDHHQVEIGYYTYSRDEQTTRVIDPHLVYAAAGQWYVAGFCHQAGADRLFRVDRVTRATRLDAMFSPAAAATAPPVFDPSPADPVVVLELEPGATWVASQYPTESVGDAGGGRQRVALRVSGEAWLARLLLRLGADARVVDGEPGPAAGAARRILGRYRPSAP
jgi:predicted DNA-binding transcriptional regulator YafY